MKNLTAFRKEISGFIKHLQSPRDGILGLTQKIIVRTREARVSEAAAGLAYYAFFSLFPFLLLLVSVGSFFVNREEVFQRTFAFLSEAIPIPPDLIKQNLETVLNMRGQIGLIGIVAIAWSASSAFHILARNIDRAWTSSHARHYAKTRLVALAIIAVFGMLLMLSLLSTTLFEVLPLFNNSEIRQDLSAFKRIFLPVIKYGVPLLVSWCMFVALYRWIPATQVTWKAAIWGAVFASVIWEITKLVFTWYLQSDLSQYELVYGSLGTLVAFLVWIYLSANIILYGAHLSAALDEGMETL